MKKLTFLKTKLSGFILGLLMIMAFGNLSFSQTDLNAGDIAIIGANYDAPDQFSFVLLVDITSGTEIRFTDSGWLSTDSFRGGEGGIKYTAPNAIAAGTVITFTYPASGDWTVDNDATLGNNGVSLSGSGDQIFAFQGESTSPNFIFGFNSEGSGWQADATSSNTSALPTGLTDGTNAIALNEIDNAIYDESTTTGTQAELLAEICSPANWSGNNSTLQTMPSGSFTVTSGSSSPDPLTAFTATTNGETEIDLAWTQNASTDAVMLIVNETGTFTDPVDGTAYAVANTDLGGTVIYNESGVSFNHTGLTDGTQYFYKAWSVDGSSNYSTAVTGDATTIVADVTAPAFVTGYPKSANISTTGCDVVVQLDEIGTAYYLVLVDGQTAPTVNEVKAGTAIAVAAANTDASASITGLTSATAYDIYIVAEDDETTPNVQTTVTKLEVTTAAILSTDAEILTFVLTKQTSEATIGDNTVSIEVAEGTNVTALAPTVTISAGAQVSPTSETVKDFTDPVPYEVTAEDGTTTKDWTVTVTVEATAPIFVTDYPKSANITKTSCDVLVQLDEIGTAYYLKLDDGATAPDVATVKAGTAINITAANTDATATISGLTAATAYDIYFVAEDAYSNTQASVTLLEVTTKEEAPAITDLFFSEYIEGSGFSKALEIYNGTGSDIDLSNYVIRGNSNGSAWKEAFELPAISLASGDVYVIAHAEADATILAVADTAVVSPYSDGTSYIVNFNGDDARALCKVSGTDTTIIDVIGNYTEDPGDGWDVAGVTKATLDHTLSRKLTTTSGNTDWTASAGTNADDSEWIIYDKNVFDYIGYFGASSSNDILSFTLPTQTKEATINTTEHTIAITLGSGTVVTALKPMIEISAGATISDTTIAHDFTASVVYTVTAENGTAQEWTATVTVATVSSEAEITSFAFAKQTGDAVIDATAGTIAIEVAFGTKLDTLKPTIAISYGATITPDTSVTRDFTAPVVYTVTAEDGTTTKEWTATVSVQESTVVTIYDIQNTTDASGDSPYLDKLVTTSGIITGVASKGFFIQDKKGLWNGIYVYTEHDVTSPARVVGDSITITAKVVEFLGTTELSYISSYVIESSNAKIPEVEIITADDIDEAIEGVLLKLEGYKCINVDFDDHHNSLYVKEGIADTLMVHNLIYRDISPVLNNEYTITGIGHYDWNNFKVEPRDADDFVATTVVNNPPTIENIVLSPTVPTSGNEVAVVADYNDDVAVTEKHFYYGFDIDNVKTEITLEAVGFSGNTFRAIIPAQETGVTIYFTIEATDVEFTTTHSGSYNVITGIDDVNMNNINIYPNPVRDMLHIGNLTNVQNITISNVIGQKVKTINNINSQELHINTSDFERGIYIISITDNNGNVRSNRLLKK
ncbi:MAG: DUF5018 domain-containing protein [Bacteroidetes bacterium]|nr:DUF5018 domain-containing protein [Bacteroidota bacterium]